MTWARRVDGPHKDIVKALRKVGCEVFDASRVGQGFPDLVVRVPFHQRPHSRIVLIEVKRPGGKLRPDQRKFLDRWPEVLIVESAEDALAELGIR